ncbi:MAG: hypothetical protein HYU36_24970 [Planctomycetes bacterium]|nr:hypothetical protein [Planctomycetota bacterium]
MLELASRSGPNASARRRIAWFCDLDQVHRDPSLLAAAQEKAGLTTLLPESHHTHTSAFRASPETDRLCPFRDWRTRPGLAEHRQTFKLGPEDFPVLPGILPGADDTPLRAVLDAAHALRIEVWGHWGLWSYGAEVYPELAALDLTGGRLNSLYARYGHGFCPSNPAVNDWMLACLRDAVRHYEIDGFYVDHARYPPPANLQALFSCACGHCEAEAGRLGYDFPAVRRAALALRLALCRLDTDRMRKAGEPVRDLEQALDLLGAPPESLQWFQLRARILAGQVKQFRDAAHEEARRPLPFGADVFPPSVSLLAGNDYALWEESADYLTGGHGAIVAWNLVPVRACRELAAAALRVPPALPESDVLRFFYRLFGLENLALPERVGELDAFDKLPAVRLFELEYRRLADHWGRRVPFYPPFPGWLPAREIERLLSVLQEVGCQGIVLSHVPLDKPDNLSVIRAFAASKV